MGLGRGVLSKGEDDLPTNTRGMFDTGKLAVTALVDGNRKHFMCVLRNKTFPE